MCGHSGLWLLLIPLSQIPKSAKLVYGEDKSTGKTTKFPLVTVHNTYVFPGVPSILENALPLLKVHVKLCNSSSHTTDWIDWTRFLCWNCFEVVWIYELTNMFYCRAENFYFVLCASVISNSISWKRKHRQKTCVHVLKIKPSVK